MLSINVIEAKNLPKKDIFGKSDPYVKIDTSVDLLEQNFRSHTIPNNHNPNWKMMVDVPVYDAETLTDVNLQVYDEEKVGKDELLGQCTVARQLLRTALHSKGQYQDVWKPLESLENDKDGIAMLHCQIGWSELKESLPSLTPTLDCQLHQGVLTVFIDSCANLGRFESRPYAKVKVTVCNVVQMTEIIEDRDPVYEHRMSFLVNSPNADRVQVQVIDDRRTDKPLGKLCLPISDLLGMTNLSVSNHVFVLEAKHQDKDLKSPHIVLSLAFRYIHRPKSHSFLRHHSLNDLAKILPMSKGHSAASAASASVVSMVSMESGENPAESVISPPKLTSTPLLIASAQENHHQRSSSFPSRSPLLCREVVESYAQEGKIQLSLKYCSSTAHFSVIVHRIRNLQYYVKHGQPEVEGLLPSDNFTRPHFDTMGTNFNDAFLY